MCSSSSGINQRGRSENRKAAEVLGVRIAVAYHPAAISRLPSNGRRLPSSPTGIDWTLRAQVCPPTMHPGSWLTYAASYTCIQTIPSPHCYTHVKGHDAEQNWCSFQPKRAMRARHAEMRPGGLVKTDFDTTTHTSRRATTYNPWTSINFSSIYLQHNAEYRHMHWRAPEY